MLRGLTYIVASALAVAVFVGVLTTVFDHTVFSSYYLEQKAIQINAYPKLSAGLSSELLQHGNITSPQDEAVLQKIISPTVLQQKITSALNQLEAYYKGNGQIPTIDLTSLVAQARAAGVQIPPNSTLDQPITFGGNQKAQGVGAQFEKTKRDSIIAAVVLLMILIALSWRRHRYAVLPDISIVCGILLGFVAIAFAIAPHIINHYVKFNFSSSAFSSIAHDITFAIIHNLSWIIGIIAVALLVGGVVGRVVVAKLNPKQSKSTAIKPLTKKPAAATR